MTALAGRVARIATGAGRHGAGQTLYMDGGRPALARAMPDRENGST